MMNEHCQRVLQVVNKHFSLGNINKYSVEVDDILNTLSTEIKSYKDRKSILIVTHYPTQTTYVYEKDYIVNTSEYNIIEKVSV